MITDNSSIADIFIALWKCMSSEKRANTLKGLEDIAGIDGSDSALIAETQYALFLVDQIVNVPASQMIQA